VEERVIWVLGRSLGKVSPRSDWERSFEDGERRLDQRSTKALDPAWGENLPARGEARAWVNYGSWGGLLETGA